MLITDTPSLEKFCRLAARSPWIAADTEFMRERHYRPRLCLVQLALADGGEAVVDALAPGLDLTPLYDLMLRSPTLKVFHSVRQDAEIFYVRAGAPPKPLFDAQVAAMLCGYRDQIGLGALAQELLDIKLDKSLRFSNWAKRPLAPAQLAYALDDVRHLRSLYRKLRAQLSTLGRESWLEEEMAPLMDGAQYQVDAEGAWRRFKPRNRSPRFLAALKALAAAREREAARRDVPRGAVLADAQVVSLASAWPRDLEALRRRPNMRAVAERCGPLVLDALERAGVALESAAAAPPPPARADSGVMGLLTALLTLRSREQRIARSLIAGNRELERLARGERQLALLAGWRREVFGAAALKLLKGRLAVRVDGGRMRAFAVDQQGSDKSGDGAAGGAAQGGERSPAAGAAGAAGVQ